MRTQLRRAYWRAFNVMARIVSIWFFLGSIVFLVDALTPGASDRVFSVMIAVLLGTPATLMLRARAFRPDLDGFSSAFSRPSSERRTWWTGDRVLSDESDCGDP